MVFWLVKMSQNGTLTSQKVKQSNSQRSKWFDLVKVKHHFDQSKWHLTAWLFDILTSQTIILTDFDQSNSQFDILTSQNESNVKLVSQYDILTSQKVKLSQNLILTSQSVELTSRKVNLNSQKVNLNSQKVNISQYVILTSQTVNLTFWLVKMSQNAVKMVFWLFDCLTADFLTFWLFDSVKQSKT